MLRMVKFAKYLVKSGYNVSVITKDDSRTGTISWDIEEPVLDNVRVYRIAPASGISLLDRVNTKLQPQFEIEWYRAVEYRLEELIKEIDFDVIISSSPPESAHLIAAAIKKRANKRWIADLRDLWSRDHYRNLDFLRRSILFWKERSTLNKADLILTVSKTWAGFLRKQYGERVVFLPNGYDKEYFDRIPREVPAKFTISYLGKLNSRHQDIAPFLAAIGKTVKDGRIPKDSLEVNFYVSGYGKPDIAGFALKHGLSEVVKEFGPVPLSRAFHIMKSSSLLLLVGWRGMSARGWRPQKLYEYMGSGTPVLLVNGACNEELAEVVAGTKSGNMANDITGIEEEIMRRYKDYTDRKISDEFQDKDRLAEYSVSAITKELCRLIG